MNYITHLVIKMHRKTPHTTIMACIFAKNTKKYSQIWTFFLFCAAVLLWRFSLLHEAKLFKLFWQAVLWGRTIKYCATELCLDVYGITFKMVTNIHFTSTKQNEIFKVVGCCKKNKTK